MKAGVIGLFLAAALVPAAVRADVVILNNGDRIEGEVVSETADEVAVRCHSGKIQYVQNLKKSTVARVEKGEAEAAGEAAPAAAAVPADPEPRTGGQSIPDKPAFLKVTMDKWRAGKAAAAGADLTRLINNSTPDELAQLSTTVKNEMSVSLAEFAAEAHWTAATELGEKRPLRLTMATKYEAPVLAPKLLAAYEEALKEEVHAKPERAKAKKPTSRPAAGTEAAATTQSAETQDAPAALGSISGWLENPNEFQADKAGATAMRTQVEYAMSLLTERMRIDPEVASDRNLRMSLTGQRTRLNALLKATSGQIARAAAEEKNAQADSKKQAEEERRKKREQARQQLLEREKDMNRRQFEQALNQGAIPLHAGQQQPPPPGNAPANPNGQPNASNTNPPAPQQQPPQQQQQK